MKHQIAAYAVKGGRESWKTTAWERARRRQLVQQLTTAGESAAQLAVRFGVTKRTIERDRSQGA